MLGIDISENNGAITNWQAIVDFGVKFVMVRATYGKHSQDEMFLHNVNSAHQYGLQCGAYHYSYALNDNDAYIEALNTKNYIAQCGVLLELPVFFDMEDADSNKSMHGFSFNRSNITSICKTYLDNIGLRCGVYASLSWLEDYIDWKQLGCSVWNAQWLNFAPEHPENFIEYDQLQGYMWQYTDNLIIGGNAYDGDWLYD